MIKSKEVVYYPSLDGLRFFAFFLVFLHHSLLGLSNNNYFNNLFIIIQKNGWVGVDLFFVLSGFLITDLLIRERKKFGNFSLKYFWIRRSLRIWPLYYLALFFGFFVFPHPPDIAIANEIKNNLSLYLMFLGNWAIVKDGYSNFVNISHLWTISLEEQFYFIWPIVLLFIKNLKRTLFVGLLVVSISILARFYLSLLRIPHPGIYTDTFARIDTLTLGGILALILNYKPKVLNGIKYFLKPGFQLFMILLFSMFLYKIYLFDPVKILNVTFGYLVIGIFLVYFVLVALKEKRGISKLFLIRPFIFLGKISYGLYVWHILAINISAHFFPGPEKKFQMILFALLLNILIGILSYYLFESIFLRMKKSFSKVKSRPI